MAYAIKDLDTGEYYRQRVGDGWYSTDIDNARLYGTYKQAKKTIDAGDHHVSYPGNRKIVVVEVKLTEV